MAKKNKYPGGIRLTLKKARELAIQEFGTAKGLKAEDNAPPCYFIMWLGNLSIRIHPDASGSGCIEIYATTNGYGCCCTQYHDADTLEENFEVEEKRRREAERENMKDWVNTNGPEVCHTLIDKLWNSGG